MSYRKMTVDGTVYEYVIGRTHLKIRGRQAVRKEEVGLNLGRRVNKSGKGYHDWIVLTPKMIANFIQGKPQSSVVEAYPPCQHKEGEWDYDKEVNEVTTFGFVPFELEIYHKKIIVNWCKNCYDENAMSI